MEWWWGLGFHTMFYLAGLSTIPKELYESARVDGASEWRIFWKITFARLRPIMLVLVVLRFGTAYALIDEYILTGGFAARPADVHVDRLHVGHGVPARRPEPRLCRGDRLDRHDRDARRRALALLRVQEPRLMATRAETATAPRRAPRTATQRAAPRRRRIRWGAIVTHGVLLTACAVILFPLVWVLLLSVKSLPDAYTNRIWPHHFDFGSYHRRSPRSTRCRRTSRTASSSRSRRWRSRRRSRCSPATRSCTCRRRASGSCSAILVASLFVPSRVTGLISIWEIQDRLGLINSTWGLILPYQTLALAVSVFIMRGVFETIPKELPESARVDGAELVHDPAPDHAAARAQRRDRRPDHELHRGVGRVAAREHAHERPGQAHAHRS